MKEVFSGMNRCFMLMEFEVGLFKADLLVLTIFKINKFRGI
jgi:hypothetical protein